MIAGLTFACYFRLRSGLTRSIAVIVSYFAADDHERGPWTDALSNPENCQSSHSFIYSPDCSNLFGHQFQMLPWPSCLALLHFLVRFLGFRLNFFYCCWSSKRIHLLPLGDPGDCCGGESWIRVCRFLLRRLPHCLVASFIAGALFES